MAVPCSGRSVSTPAEPYASRVPSETSLRFVKGHGTENDFLVLPDPDDSLDLSVPLVRRLCDRRAGVGGDGILRVVRTAASPEVAHLSGEAEWFMDYRNADGSLAEMCGNGIRVYARYLIDATLVRPGTFRLATRHGVREVSVPERGDVSVDMGTATLDPQPVEVAIGGRALSAHAVDLGNPHAVLLLDEPVDTLDLTTTAVPVVRFPAGANVEVVNVLAHGPDYGRLRMRVFERGVGETRSCGTGACAAVVAAGESRTWTVEVPGGLLRVSRHGERLLLTGPAVLVAAGELCAQWLADAEKDAEPDAAIGDGTNRRNHGAPAPAAVSPSTG